MHTFFKKFSVLALLILLSATGLIAEAPTQTCKNEELPCKTPPYTKVYQCFEKGDICCDPKSEYHRQCCEGILVEAQYDHPFECSDVTPYISDDSACCEGIQYSKSWEGCCRGCTYLLAYEVCCSGVITNIDSCCSGYIIDPKTTGCCKGKEYEKSTHACCGDKIVCGINHIRLTPKECGKCIQRDPSCFYATIEGSKEMYFAQPCGDSAVIVFPQALCPDTKVQICMHPRCGTAPVITGTPKGGYTLEGVCEW